jgi:hypothetical protein
MTVSLKVLLCDLEIPRGRSALRMKRNEIRNLQEQKGIW